MGDVRVNTGLLSKAFKEYQEATKKEIPEILNRAGRNIAYRAAQYTPKATGARIKSELKADPHLAYALTSMALKKKGTGTLPAPEFSERVSKFISRRAASAGFIRSGWAEAVIKLGGTFRGKKVGKGHGWASKASLFRFVTTIANTVPGVNQIGTKALQKAVDFVAVDMLNHARDKLNKIARRNSGG